MNYRFIFIALLAFIFGFSNTSFSQENNSIDITPFSAEISADSSFLNQEAGISAYGQVNYVDLDLAENAFKYVEKKTSDYIIGAVALDNYDETHDVHVYVDTSNWIIAYYLSTEKPSKIIDWKEYYSSRTMTGSKLELALSKVVGAMSAFLPDVDYYDFRYPNATNIMIVTDEESISGVSESFRRIIR